MARHRRMMIQYMTSGLIECPPDRRKTDYMYFNWKGTLSISLVTDIYSGWVSLACKKRLMLMRHITIPRLCRRRYLTLCEMKQELQRPSLRQQCVS